MVVVECESVVWSWLDSTGSVCVQAPSPNIAVTPVLPESHNDNYFQQHSLKADHDNTAKMVSNMGQCCCMAITIMLPPHTQRRASGSQQTAFVNDNPFFS